MIRFLHSRGHDYTVKEVKAAAKAPTVRCLHYDALIRARSLPGGTYIFTDVDRLSFWDLEHASHLYLQMKNAGLRVLNNPALVRTRYPLLRALHAAGLNDFNAYRVDEMDAVKRFPVFVRKIHGHRAPLSELLQTREELQKGVATAIAAGTPRENVLIVEFAAEPLRPGCFAKCRLSASATPSCRTSACTTRCGW
jgi:hypothetical protein